MSPERVKELTDGKGVPVVYDGVGKDTFSGSLDCLAPRGMMVSFGNASGSGVINIATWVDPCLSFGDDLYEENDTCSTGTALNDGLYGELTISLSDLDMYTFTVPDGGHHSEEELASMLAGLQTSTAKKG